MRPDLRRAVAEVTNALNHLRAAQAAGDFAAQGQALTELEQAVQRFQAATNPAGQSITPATGGGHG